MSQAAVMGAFNRALSLESHHLSKNPGLIFQQLQNRLQWEEDDEIRALLGSSKRGSGPRRRAVIRLKTQQRESKALVETISAGTGTVHDCAIDIHGEYVVSVAEDGMARQWDRRSGQEIRSVPIAPTEGGSYTQFQGGATCCAVSPDGAFVVCGGAQGKMRIWDAKTGADMWGFSGPGYTMNACAVLPDASGVLWASVQESGRLSAKSIVEIRDPEGPKQTIEVKGYVRSCAISPDATLLALAVSDGMTGRVEMRNIRTGISLWKDEHAPRATFDLGSGRQEGFAPEIADCAFSPGGEFLVTAAQDSTLRLWNPKSGTWFRSLSEPMGSSSALDHATERTACAVSPDGEVIISGSRGGPLTLWDAADGTRIDTLEGHGDEVTAVAFGSDGSFAVSASRDGTIRIWDMEVARGG